MKQNGKGGPIADRPHDPGCTGLMIAASVLADLSRHVALQNLILSRSGKRFSSPLLPDDAEHPSQDGAASEFDRVPHCPDPCVGRMKPGRGTLGREVVSRVCSC